MQVDIIVATRDYGRFLGEALASAVAQKGADVLVTVVDDGSTDNTADVVAGFDPGRVQYLRRDTARGVAAARNMGIVNTCRPYVAFLDGDDVLPARRTALLVELLRASAADYAHGVSRTFQQPNPAGSGPTTLIAGPAPGNLLIRRDLFARVGMMDETVGHLNLAHWLLRAQRAGAVGVATDEVVVERRLHDRNMSRDDQKRHAALDLVREHLRSAGLGDQRHRTETAP